MKIKCEYAHGDITRLIIRDLQEKFPGLVAAEDVLVGGEQLVEVEVTLATGSAPVPAPGVPPATPPAAPGGPMATTPLFTHTVSTPPRSPFDDPPALPPPPRPHSEREFNPARASEPAGIETWGVKPRG